MMKKKVIGIFALVLTLASCSDSTARNEQQVVTSKRINGVLTVDVTTTKDGVKKHEVFRGKAGEAKLKELGKENIDLVVPHEEKKVEEESKRVQMIDDNGKKSLTIQETKNGKTTNKSYSGDEADKKMKEIEARGSAMDE